MEKSRVKNAVMNTGISGITTALKFLLSFLSRTIFIHVLGSEILGLNGLLTSILTTLSLAELGIGNAIVYSLYKPINENHWSVVHAIMDLYRRIYQILAVVVLVIGLAIVPFLPMLTDKAPHGIFIYYIILLTNSVVSYLLTYNRSLLIATEKNYIVSSVDFFSILTMTILQCVMLLIFKSYGLFLIIQVIATIGGNVFLTLIVRKRFDVYFKSVKKESVPRTIINRLKKNVFGTFASKIGDVAVNGTNNILISLFINLFTVGLYSNYQLIISAIQQIIFSFSSSLTATIGNMAAKNEENSDDLENMFYSHQFMNYALTFFSSAMLFGIFPIFIKIWIGDHFLLTNWVTFLMVFVFVTNGLRYTGLAFIDALGISYEQRVKPLLEAFFNLALSILFLKVFKMGLSGILIATIVTNLFVATIYESFVVFHYGLKKSVLNFYKKYCLLIAEIFANLLLVFISIQYFKTRYNFPVVWQFVFDVIITLAVSTILFLIFSFKKKELKYLLKFIF